MLFDLSLPCTLFFTTLVEIHLSTFLWMVQQSIVGSRRRRDRSNQGHNVWKRFGCSRDESSRV